MLFAFVLASSFNVEVKLAELLKAVCIFVIWIWLFLGPGVCQFRIDPLRFLAGWCKGRLNQAFSFVLV